MSPKLLRLLFVAAVVTGASAPMFGAYAAGQNRSVDAFESEFVAPGKSAYQPLEIYMDDTVRWNIVQGEHTVTPKDRNQWGGTGSPGKLTTASDPYTKKFTTPGKYFYFCEIHGGRDEDDNLTGMWGVIHVIDPTPPPPPPPPPSSSSSTTTTTRLGATPPATTATAPPATTATAPPATSRPGPTAPAPTTTTKGDKGKKSKDETTTTTIPPLTPPPPPIDLPDEAIVPTLPGASATPSADPELPTDTPEGEALALLKAKKNNGGDAMKLLIVSGLGLGALGVGTAGYKYANRSSKYFPA